MDEIAASTLSWITERYGPASFDEEENGGLAVSVPVHDGTVTGRGETRSSAIAALYAELTLGAEDI